MSNDLRPRAISGDILVGTNSKWHHIQQAYQLGIIDPDDIVLGFFDGVFFDEAGKRVGGLALSDFILITNTRVTLWMRDQVKDYVDHFPLSHVFVAEKSQKDLLHGTLRLTLLMPEVDITNKTKEPSRVILSFDFIPLPDLSLLADMLDVLGSAMRDMVEGGAGPVDRAQAILILFQKVFISKFQAPESAQNNGLGTANGNASNDFAADGSSGNGFDPGMTPLRRLDGFDESARPMGNQPPAPKSSNGYGYTNPNEARLFQTGEAPSYSPYNQEVPYPKNPNSANDMNWSNGQQYAASSRFSGGIRQRRGAGDTGQGDYQAQTPKGEIPPESIYMMGRVARTAWDGLSKMRQEAESRAMPALQSLRNSGFNLKEMTEFITAANGLMETVSKNPAARELAMAFINKSTGGLSFGNSNKSNEERRTPKVENVDDDDDKAPSLRTIPLAGKALKVERRTSGKPSNITSVHLSEKESRPVSVESGETPTSEMASVSTEQLSNSVKASAGDESNPEPKKVKRLPIRRKGVSTAEEFMSESDTEYNTSVGVKTDLSIFMTNNNQYDKQENQATLAVSDGPALN
ncbi:MAG: hypothetical protein HXX08_04910 [Chloroflexi bacterium]|uniref:Uncharacterized protein n=1 Tax=Candidatus Chlorohelix allophototropha TaxID=3003348 RepID=A0A8T7LW82_9CHLR|nr:hypothetical protein [Chloroflexota bacterium]WJW67081.1 hypothetical protein OZ401_000330 [Chloroflexota bacterium L227-S17]